MSKRLEKNGIHIKEKGGNKTRKKCDIFFYFAAEIYLKIK